MLPDIRQSDYLYPVPKFDLNQDDVEGFTQELVSPGVKMS